MLNLNIRERWSALSLRNKVLSVLSVVVALIAIGRELVTMARLQYENAELRERVNYYEERIREESLLILNLSSPEYLERYAREKYHMHADNEEIYIIRK